MTNEQIARVCHEANKGYCESIGDLSQKTWDDADMSIYQKTWDDAPDWYCQSAIEDVTKAMDGATPEQLHESWCEAKKRDGWIYGRVKDSGVRTHPCLVPYAQLPEDQKRKDALFQAVVRALA